MHGDDFTVSAPKKNIRYIADGMAMRYKIELRGILGPDHHDVHEITILNRVMRWTANGLEYAPDPRHAEIIIEELGINDAKSIGTPGVKQLNAGETQPLEPEFATKYRVFVARANYLAQGRADIQYVVKELAGKMSVPDDIVWIALKRLGRYLVGVWRLITLFP